MMEGAGGERDSGEAETDGTCGTRKQALRNKRGEILFRRKLVEQQVEGRRVFDDEFDSEGIEEILRERMSDTVSAVRKLRDSGITVAPFVEIGAERGQRALALVNDLHPERGGCEGAALDLSLDMLRSCEHYRCRFDLEHSPLRICADAYRLPFASESVPFVFCYQTLHHFPEPGPILSEVYRILMPGGHLFFAEEPYKRGFHWNLYSVKGGVCSARKKGVVRRVLDRFFAKEILNEESFGVIENHDIPWTGWRDALREFEEADLVLNAAGIVRVDPEGGRNPVKRWIAELLGGTISGVCRKEGSLEPGEIRPLESTLICPKALARGKELSLRRHDDRILGEEAGTVYPVVDGVAMLIEPETRETLYGPEEVVE